MSVNYVYQGGAGPTPYGKIHLKFPFWLFDYLPNPYPGPTPHTPYKFTMVSPGQTQPLLLPTQFFISSIKNWHLKKKARTEAE